MSGLPLLGHTGLDATFAWLPDGPRSAGQYLADVAALQALLEAQSPAGGWLLNLCQDRYRFAVGFAAGLLSGKTSLQPASQSPETLLTWKDAAGGWDALINKSSTTWRELAPQRKTPGSDAEWRLLLREYPQLIRRPVVVLADGRVAQGFSDNGFKKLFGVGA